jgi:hypothetical protein
MYASKLVMRLGQRFESARRLSFLAYLSGILGKREAPSSSLGAL